MSTSIEYIDSKWWINTGKSIARRFQVNIRKINFDFGSLDFVLIRSDVDSRSALFNRFLIKFLFKVSIIKFKLWIFRQFMRGWWKEGGYLSDGILIFGRRNSLELLFLSKQDHSIFSFRWNYVMKNYTYFCEQKIMIKFHVWRHVKVGNMGHLWFLQ